MVEKKKKFLHFFFYFLVRTTSRIVPHGSSVLPSRTTSIATENTTVLFIVTFQRARVCFNRTHERSRPPSSSGRDGRTITSPNRTFGSHAARGPSAKNVAACLKQYSPSSHACDASSAYGPVTRRDCLARRRPGAGLSVVRTLRRNVSRTY